MNTCLYMYINAQKRRRHGQSDMEFIGISDHFWLMWGEDEGVVAEESRKDRWKTGQNFQSKRLGLRGG